MLGTWPPWLLSQLPREMGARAAWSPALLACRECGVSPLAFWCSFSHPTFNPAMKEGKARCQTSLEGKAEDGCQLRERMGKGGGGRCSGGPLLGQTSGSLFRGSSSSGLGMKLCKRRGVCPLEGVGAAPLAPGSLGCRPAAPAPCGEAWCAPFVREMQALSPDPKERGGGSFSSSLVTHVRTRPPLPDAQCGPSCDSVVSPSS